MLVGNDRADQQGKGGLQHHPTNWTEHEDADDRTFIAALVQHLTKSIWQKLFESDMEIKR